VLSWNSHSLLLYRPLIQFLMSFIIPFSCMHIKYFSHIHPPLIFLCFQSPLSCWFSPKNSPPFTFMSCDIHVTFLYSFIGWWAPSWLHSLAIVNSVTINMGEQVSLYLINTIFFFSGVTGLWAQGFVLTKQAFYHSSHTFSPFLLWLFWRWSLLNYLPGVDLNYDSPDLSLPSS
jgi:hypothetical protein